MVHHPVPEGGGGDRARLGVADGDFHVAPRPLRARKKLAFEAQHLRFHAGEEGGHAGLAPLAPRRALRPADNRIVRYREYYGSSGSPNEGLRLDPQVVAAKMRLMETHERARGMRFFRNPADPSIWGEHGHETSVGMLFQREGFRWLKAATGPGSRVSGAHVIVWLLNQDRLAVTSDCADFLRTVPVLPADPNRIEDVDTHAEDHCWDELRYAVTARVTLSKQDLARASGGAPARRRPVLLDDLLAGRGPKDVDLYELLRRR